jgi:hypothetical protein
MREPDTDTKGRRVGPSAHVCTADAGPLREVLAAAFGSGLVRAGRSAAVQAQP